MSELNEALLGRRHHVERFQKHRHAAEHCSTLIRIHENKALQSSRLVNMPACPAEALRTGIGDSQGAPPERLPKSSGDPGASVPQHGQARRPVQGRRCTWMMAEGEGTAGGPSPKQGAVQSDGRYCVQSPAPRLGLQTPWK